jgi:pimeloyl-ACP methyl ester carboxylesterase
LARRRRRWLLAALLVAALAFVLFWPEPPAASGAWLARAGLVPRFADVNGLRLRYVRAGSGPPVVLLHGFASSIYSWAEVLPALARDHDVVAVDFPGFGGSEVRPDITSATLVESVPALLDRLGLSRAGLVGHSLGGAVAAGVGVRHPERVETLALLDAAGFNFAPADRPWIVRLVGSPAGALFDYLPVRRRVVAMGLRQVFHDDALVTPERVDEYVAPLRRPGTLKALRSILHSSDRVGLPQSLAGLRLPTLVLWGSEDSWIPPSDADRFVAAIPGARKVVLAGCGHMPQEERPRETVAALRAFWEGAALSARGR